MLLPGPDLDCVGPWHFAYFPNIFLPTIAEDQKKVVSSKHETPGTEPYGQFVLVIALHS